MKASRADPGDPNSLVKAIESLCRAARLTPLRQERYRITAQIRELVRPLLQLNVDWSQHIVGCGERRIVKAAILKPYVSPREKGVVFISFEQQWARLLGCPNLREFSERFTLVVSPTWSPPHTLVNSIFPEAYGDDVYCLISNEADHDYLPWLSQRYRTVPLCASSWVNPNLFENVPYENRTLDIVMVANFAKFKRQWLVFKALARMPRNLKVCLMGQKAGARSRASIVAEARAFGVDDRIEVQEDVSHEFVLDRLAHAKISFVASRREGSCVAVVESMFANTPVGLFEDAEVGSRAFINEKTGRFFRYDGLASQLLAFLRAAPTLSPRQWACENVSCFRSTQLLNERLKADGLAEGREWTQDIAALQWRPDPQLVHEADRERLRSSYDDVRNRFGIELG